jgi:hypothetical protein
MYGFNLWTQGDNKEVDVLDFAINSHWQGIETIYNLILTSE